MKGDFDPIHCTRINVNNITSNIFNLEPSAVSFHCWLLYWDSETANDLTNANRKGRCKSNLNQSVHNKVFQKKVGSEWLKTSFKLIKSAHFSRPRGVWKVPAHKAVVYLTDTFLQRAPSTAPRAAPPPSPGKLIIYTKKSSFSHFQGD